MRKLLMSFALTLAMVTPAFGQTSIQSSNPLPKGKHAKPGEKICERVEKTGSRLGGGQVCMTGEQWREIRREDREDLERSQKNTHQKPS